MSALLSAQKISYSVGGAQLLIDVDIEVRSGELVAVIGPNGAGKSTLVSVLAGDIEPAAGKVLIADTDIAGIDVGDLAGIRAVLGQGRTANIPFTVGEVVAMGLRREVNGKVTDSLAAMDLTGLAHRVVGSLSGGEHTRVEIARILAQGTPLLLLDEPLAALDVAHQERVMRHLRSLAANGRGVLAVFHDLNAAAAHADRFVLMARGRIVADGPGSSVLEAGLLSEMYGYPMMVVTVAGRLVILPAE